MHVKLQVSSRFVNGNQIQSITTDAPQVPINELTLGLNGGRTAGVFQARNDLCFRTGSTSSFRDVMGEYSFAGWNGKATATTQVRGKRRGLRARRDGALTGATRQRPSLDRDGQDAPRLAGDEARDTEAGRRPARVVQAAAQRLGRVGLGQQPAQPLGVQVRQLAHHPGDDAEAGRQERHPAAPPRRGHRHELGEEVAAARQEPPR